MSRYPNPTMSEADTVERRYWSIGEVSEMIGADAPSQIRFWETIFDAPQLRRGLRNRRVYTAPDIERLRLIAGLARWFKLERARVIYEEGRAECMMDILEPKNG